MWIFRFTYCLFRGHSFIDITSSRKPYKYCLHCGKIQEPIAILRHSSSQDADLNKPQQAVVSD